MNIGRSKPERWSDYRFSQPASGGNSFLFLLAGVAFGAGLAFLFSPKSGPELRRALGRGCRKTIDELTSRVRELRDRTQDLGGELRERVPKLLPFSRRVSTRGGNPGV